MDDFTRAVLFATEKHAGQTRKDGTPYIYHPMEVARMVKDAGYGERYQITAILHDVLEDTDATEEEVLSFGQDIYNAVKFVTRPAGMNEAEYVDAILKNHMAAVVKNADKMHNVWSIQFLGEPGKKRDPKTIQTAHNYVKKAEKYYSEKFSPALDDLIQAVFTQLECDNVPHRDILGEPHYKMRLWQDQSGE